MNPGGHCTGCSAPLAVEQRYCVEGGQRVGPPLVMPYVPIAGGAEPGPVLVAGRWPLPVPAQAATAFAALALGFGLIIGNAISPTLAGTLAGTQTIIQMPAEEPAPPAPAPSSGGSGGGGGSPAPVIAAAPTTITSGIPDDTDDGGGKQRKQKDKPAYLSGTVVHANPAAHSYTINNAGALIAIHAATLPVPGTKVRVPIELLDNRTYKEDGKRQANGQSASETISGTVSFSADDVPYTSDPLAPTDTQDVYVISSTGASVLVRVAPAAGTSPPPVGSVVTVPVEVRDSKSPALGLFPGYTSPFSDPNCQSPGPQPAPPLVPAKTLFQAGTPEVAPDPPGPGFVSIESVVQGRCDAAGKVILAADDIRESLLDLAPLGAKAGIDLTRLQPGQVVLANVEIAENPPVGAPGPVLTITGVADDSSAKNANDPSLAQGDL